MAGNVSREISVIHASFKTERQVARERANKEKEDLITLNDKVCEQNLLDVFCLQCSVDRITQFFL